MKKMVLLNIFVFLLYFISCNETKKVTEVFENIELTGKYTITRINGKNITDRIPTIVFNSIDKSASGNGGCNGYFGNYTLAGNKLNFGIFTVTEMYCDEPIMDIERAFFKALSETGFFKIENNLLTLYSNTNRTVLLKANHDKKE